MRSAGLVGAALGLIVLGACDDGGRGGGASDAIPPADARVADQGLGGHDAARPVEDAAAPSDLGARDAGAPTDGGGASAAVVPPAPTV